LEVEQFPCVITTGTGSTYNERDKQNTEAPLGIATTRVLERGLAAVGLLQEASPVFTHQQSVDKAGVLLAVPALIAQGLLKCKEVYQELSSGYYGLRSTILTIAFMALCRIKNLEQLKQQKVGELGSLLGLDRVPETRCLRDKIQQIVKQHKAKDFNTLLFNHWLGVEMNFSFT